MRFRWLLFSFAAVCGVALGQVNPTGSISGQVADPSGAVIPGASVVLTSTENGQVTKTESDGTGRFVIPNLAPGNYDAKVNHAGFATADYKQVVVVVGQIYTLNAKLAVGSASQSVEVQAGQEVIETQQTQISDEVVGAQITQMPITDRNAQDLAVLLPAATTSTVARDTNFMGLERGTINMTFDGINIQDNGVKSSDGYYAVNNPRTDDVSEFSLTTAANDASASGEGAVQIALVSSRGTNQWHGGGWDYLRNTDLNAANYFNNLAGIGRNVEHLNEFGYKIGGPILKNKLFFFTDLDYLDYPTSQSRTRDLLNATAVGGVYVYTPSAQPNAAALAAAPWVGCNAGSAAANVSVGGKAVSLPGGTCGANVMQLGANFGGPSAGAINPAVNGWLSSLLPVPTTPGVGVTSTNNFNNTAVTFANAASQHRIYPDMRLDYNINAKNTLELDFHFSYNRQCPDILNSDDASFPIAPYSLNTGCQISDRDLGAAAWRWSISPSMNNELRIGFAQTAPTWFNSGEESSFYPSMTTNFGTINFNPGLTVGGLATNPFRGYSPTHEVEPVHQANDNLSWLHGNHSMAIGGSYTFVSSRQVNASEGVATLGLGLSNQDPLFGSFGTTNLPGITSTDLTDAEALYGTLNGRVTSYSGNVFLDSTNHQFTLNQNELYSVSQSEIGMYFTDNWRYSNALTVNYGLRWEWENAPTDDYNEFYAPVGGIAGVYGVSGTGNIFSPGTLTGGITSLAPANNEAFYSSYPKDFAPSLGLAWSPNYGSQGLWHALFGDSGKSVFRAGYSIAYSREGLGNYTGVAPGNPGFVDTQSASAAGCGTGSAALSAGQFCAGTIAAGSQVTGVTNSITSYGSTLTLNPALSQSVSWFDPNYRPPMVQSWSAGIQRQIGPNTAVEVRYVGNHAAGLPTELNLNEVNIFQNGFLTQFQQAATNLGVCQANATACKAAEGAGGVAAKSQTANSFADWGLTGQGTVPIFNALATGKTTNAPSNSLFTNGTDVSDLENGLAGTLASSFVSSGSTLNTTTLANLVSAGEPLNYFTVNPDARSANDFTNLGQSTYNALQIEVRRRMHDGLQFNSSYTFSKSLTNTGLIGSTSLQELSLAKSLASFNIPQQFKVEMLMELPFGEGRHFRTGLMPVDKVLGGWEWDSSTRWQTGSLYQLTGGAGGTVNGNDGGVIMNDLSVQQMQSFLGVYHTTSPAPGAVYDVPTSLLGTNLQKSNTAFLQPCNTAGAFCGHPFVYGPGFLRADWSLLRNFDITEKMKGTLRADFLDAFNNANFQPPSGNLSSTSFGQVTSAFSDSNNTNDLGGRAVELVFRLNF